MGRVILQHVYMYLSFNSMESVIDYQYLRRHEMSSTENSNILKLTKIDKEACYNSCEFKKP